MTDTPKPLTADEIAERKQMIDERGGNRFEARYIATIEQQREQIEKLSATCAGDSKGEGVMTKGISVANLEHMMGKKADHVSDYVFDQETGSFTRRITFKLDGPKRRKRPAMRQGHKGTL